MNLTSISSIELFIAVGVASFLGSLHCVGMCGPFAMMATGNSSTKTQMLTRLSLYHGGRLTTYLIAGLFVGVAGTLVSTGGHWFGVQSAAARVAGIAMILLGLFKLVQLARPSTTHFHHLHGVSKSISGWLASLRPRLGRMPSGSRAFAAGSLTTLLPCGWLYIFLLVAGGTGGIASAMLLMFAFWVGTLPALSSLVLGVQHMTPRFKKLMPLVGGLLLVLTGCYTAMGRATADLSILTKQSQAIMAKSHAMDEGKSSTTAVQKQNSTSLEQLTALKKEPLPCCQLKSTTKETDD